MRNLSLMGIRNWPKINGDILAVAGGGISWSTTLVAVEMTIDQRNKIEEILKILDQYPPPTEVTNRRQSTRVRIRAHLNCFLLAVPGFPSIQIHTRNISTAGIGFVSRRPFRAGELVVIEMNLLPKNSKLILTEATFNSYVREGLYEVGCTFREAAPKNEYVSENIAESLPANWLGMIRSHGA